MSYRKKKKWSCSERDGKVRCVRERNIPARFNNRENPYSIMYAEKPSRPRINPLTYLTPVPGFPNFILISYPPEESALSERGSRLQKQANIASIYNSEKVKELKLSEYLTLRLENGETNIYVGGKHFMQCKYLLLEIDRKKVKQYDLIGSIDEAAEKLGHEQEFRHTKVEIKPETEFWGHSSNLQAWVENDYDTRLIHSNLGWPLLKELVLAGDEKAKGAYKKEIILRLNSGYLPTIIFILKNNILDLLSKKETEQIWPKENYMVILENAIENENVPFLLFVDFLSIFSEKYIEQKANLKVSDLVDMFMSYLSQIVGKYKRRKGMTLTALLPYVAEWLPIKKIQELYKSDSDLKTLFFSMAPYHVRIMDVFDFFAAIFSKSDLDTINVRLFRHRVGPWVYQPRDKFNSYFRGLYPSE